MSPEQNPTIRLHAVSVRYCVPHEPIRSFKEYAIRTLQNRITYHEFWALRDVDLEVQQGEMFGVVGRNGAGKSTLLKVISRVLRPTKGQVWVRGRVSPMLELGAGFHPELTGRENVFLNGTLLGHSHQDIENHFESVVDFAEMWEFIDAPLRTYSTGMVARLGFAVATAWEPEILILDEVLAVGDEAFQRKCQARMTSFRDNGATVILVSHSMAQVQALCQRALWLDHGIVHALGTTNEVVAQYQQASA
jgi:ABC-type polysaccharide/polyol phosphate transport system ATPase subunit